MSLVCLRWTLSAVCRCKISKQYCLLLRPRRILQIQKMLYSVVISTVSLAPELFADCLHILAIGDLLWTVHERLETPKIRITTRFASTTYFFRAVQRLCIQSRPAPTRRVGVDVKNGIVFIRCYLQVLRSLPFNRRLRSLLSYSWQRCLWPV